MAEISEEELEKRSKEICSWLKVTVLELIGELDKMNEETIEREAMLGAKTRILKSMEHRLDLLREQAEELGINHEEND